MANNHGCITCANWTIQATVTKFVSRSTSLDSVHRRCFSKSGLHVLQHVTMHVSTQGFMKRISVATSTRNPYNLWNRNIDKYKNDTYGSRSVRFLIYEQNCAIENAFLKYHRNEKNRTQRFTHSTRINDKNFFIF